MGTCGFEGFESQESLVEASFWETYEAKLGEWKATALAQAIEENRADAVDTSRAVLKVMLAGRDSVPSSITDHMSDREAARRQ